MRRLASALIIIVLLSACGSGEIAQPTLTQVATTVPATAPTVQPTESPAQPTKSPAQPTESPAQPTEPSVQPTDTPKPTPTPVPTAEGQISFTDHLAVADQLVLTMRGIAPPRDGLVYEGWLIAADGVTEVSTGVFQVDADGDVDYTWTSPTGENLIANYVSFAVTGEPAEDSDPSPSNQVMFRGAADPAVLVAARRVFAANDGDPATPRNVSYGQGLLSQSKVAKDHTFNALNAAAIGAYGEMRVHCEHVINIVEGAQGPRFADYTGDGRAENPGDGFGTLVYAQEIATLLPVAGGDFSTIEALLVAIQDKAGEISAASDIASAKSALDEFKSLGNQLGDVAPAFYAAAQAAVSYPVEPTP